MLSRPGALPLGRACHQKVVAARRGHRQRALGALLALDVLEGEAARLDLLEGRPRRCQHLTALEVVDEGDEAARRQDLKAFGPGRLAALGGRADEAALLAQGMDRRRRTEERRVGQECVSTGRSRWLPINSKKK